MRRLHFVILAICAIFIASGSTFANPTPSVIELLKQPSPSSINTLFPKGLSYPVELRILYQIRGFEPYWPPYDPQSASSMLTLVESLVLIADGNGLEDSTQPIEELRRLIQDPAALTSGRTEIAVMDWVIKLAFDLNGTSINLRYLYTGWPFDRPSTGIVHGLAQAMSKNDVTSFLVSLAPNSVDYIRQIGALRLYKAIRENGGWVSIPAGPTMKPGMHDPRIKLIRERLEAEAYALPQCQSEQEANYYNEELREIVVDYQSRNGLEADGNIGLKTLASLNVPVARRIDQIRANMARDRAMPRDWPERYAIVNIADASAKFVVGNQIVYHAPVVIGRPDRKTPYIQSALRSIIFNPSWHVPAKIAREDILPKLRKDPHYLEKMGFVISGSGNDPHGSQINWEAIKKTEFAFRLRQSPGEMNALGRIKFDFDNDFSVYLHGTPHEELFARSERHLSSGCIRLMEPERVAELVLSDNEGVWTRDEIESEIDKGTTHWIKVANPMPFYIIYQTTLFPSTDSSIHFRPDVYNYDRIILNAMAERARGK